MVCALACLLAAALTACVAAPTASADQPAGFTGAFRLQGSNGYSVLALVFSRRADGKGGIELFVSGRHGGSAYSAPAMVTSKTVKADLGALGSVDFDLVGSGRTVSEHSICDLTPTRFEAGHYVGKFEFHGEEGYTDAVASRATFTLRPILNIVCAGFGSQEVSAVDLPGARLRTRSRGGGRSVALQINKNRPMGRVTFSATMREQVGPIRIQRAVQGAAPANAFAYEPDLHTATVSPPFPFSGSATFRRGTEPANRWTGSLTLDFPGHSGVPLAGAAVRAHLVHAQRRVENQL